MFGRQGLKNQIEYYKGIYEQYADKYVTERDAREATSRELTQALESVEAYEARVNSLQTELADSAALNQALTDENKDLFRQLQLLESVLKQVSITIKLPARKK